MSFRVKLRVKRWKLPDIIDQAREYRKAIEKAWKLPDYPKGNECVPSGCSVCGMKFTDAMGRPIAMGYACPNIRCPGKATCTSIGVSYDVKSMLWNGSYSAGGVQ